MTSGELETEDVSGVVESVKMGEDRGMEIQGREIPTELLGGRGSMHDIGIMDVVGEDVIGKVSGIT